MRTILRRLRSERGAINFVTTFSVLAIAGTIYLAYAYLPHWFKNREILSAMREAAYQAWRVRDDDEIRRMVRAKTDRLLTVNDGTGDYPVIDEGMIRVNRDDANVYIELGYQIPMHFPWTQKVRTISFNNSVKCDLRVPTE